VLTKAGLVGIVAAVKEGRITFQRIQTYTLNAIIKKIVTVLFLIVGLIMTGHAILTPLLMVIVMVTGDFLSMSLTTDNVRPSPTPNAWRIGRLTIAGVTMGICLLAFCSGVLAVGKIGMHLAIEALRTLAFILLVFGSQAMIYAIRERRHLWGSRPSLLLAVSSVADIAIASTLAVGGIAMARIPISLVAGTLAAAALFALIMDLVKVLVFTRLGIASSTVTHVTGEMAKKKVIPIAVPGAAQPKASDSKPEAKAVEPNAGAKSDAKTVAKSETQAEPKSEPTIELNPQGKPEPKPEAKAITPADLTPRIAKRAYELYQQGGRQDGSAVQNWEKAESEIRKDLAKAESPGETKAAPGAEAKDRPQPETKAETSSDVPPQLIKRVHELYEELGRQDVRAVEDWEKAQREIQKEQSAK
jgi:hypothetical protein